MLNPKVYSHKTVTSTASKTNSTGSSAGQDETAPASRSITTGTTDSPAISLKK